MSIEELRKIPIHDLLAHLGIEPVSRSRGGTQLMYRSPLRDENTASFSVSVTKNLWNDFGSGQGGNVIDLAIVLNGNCSFHKAAQWLEEQSYLFGHGSQIGRMSIIEDRLPKPHSGLDNVRIVSLTHPTLLRYMRSRGIPDEISQRYCKEVHYTAKGKPFFAVGFMNILGGVELRNPFFKGCYGSKAPSIVHVDKTHRTSACCVFEGFIDFLSYLVLQRKQHPIAQDIPYDCIVLNSTSLLQKTIPFIQVYEHAYCYLDNDKAGEQAGRVINSTMMNKVALLSEKYADFNDLNDYLQYKKS